MSEQYDPYQLLISMAQKSAEDLRKLSELHTQLQAPLSGGASDSTDALVSLLKAHHDRASSVEALNLPTSYDDLKNRLMDLERGLKDQTGPLNRLLDPLGILSALSQPAAPSSPETKPAGNGSATPAVNAPVQQDISLLTSGNIAGGRFLVTNATTNGERYRFEVGLPAQIPAERWRHVSVEFDPSTVELAPQEKAIVGVRLTFEDTSYFRGLGRFDSDLEFCIDVRNSSNTLSSKIWVNIRFEGAQQ